MRTLLVLLLLNFSCAWTQNANEILDGVVNKINQVNDYRAEVSIKAAIPFIKVPVAKATIYFKKKDKFKVVSKGIAILPKQGLNELTGFLSNKSKYTAVLSGDKDISTHKTKCITVIPNDENAEIVLAKVYIDSKESLIYRTILTTKSSGTVSVDYEYGDQIKYGLPSKVVSTVDIKKFKMPKSVASDIRNNDKDQKKKNEKTGTITITFSGYQINKGIKDSFFKED